MITVPLTRGKFALIDDADADLVLAHKWYADNPTPTRWYAATHIKRKIVRMHTLLTGFALTDHRDADGLNNRRDNLRECTTSQNHANRRKNFSVTSSRFKGVYFDKSRSKWAAEVKWHRKRYRLGRFDTEEAAALAYQAKATELFGEFARF
jgi:hypothetical protein